MSIVTVPIEGLQVLQIFPIEVSDLCFYPKREVLMWVMTSDFSQFHISCEICRILLNRVYLVKKNIHNAFCKPILGTSVLRTFFVVLFFTL